MFVIIGALENLRPEEKALDIPQRVSAVLRNAGVSITVTSFTDCVAFMIGASTVSLFTYLVNIIKPHLPLIVTVVFIIIIIVLKYLQWRKLEKGLFMRIQNLIY